MTATTPSGPDVGWTEVGPGCFVRRYDSYDLSVGAVVGADGVLVVDTRASLREADVLVADLRRLTSAPVRWVVDTHWHFDHTFGNARFDDAAIYGHETVPDDLATHAPAVRADLAATSAESAADMAALRIRPPDHTFASVAVVDLGDRMVELVHPGRGHTAGDVVVRVPDADVVYAGDLVEESGPPAFGDDAYPLEWAPTLDVVGGLLTPDSAVVPGHGAVVDAAFVREQRGAIELVAQTIRRLVNEGVPVEQALDAAEWPYPRPALVEAVRRGYAHLAELAAHGADRRTGLAESSLPGDPAGRRQLPLL